MAQPLPSGEPAVIELSDEDEEQREQEFRAARAANDRKAYNRFLEIFDKYARDFDGIGDEIDLLTGEIVVNNGHIQGMKDETDIGAELEDDHNDQVDTRNRFVRALTVEPDLVVLSDSEEDVPMEESGESEEDEVKCEACWESDRRHCPHIKRTRAETPEAKKPKSDINSAALDHSRLRQFGAELSARKPRPFKAYNEARSLARPDMRKSASASTADTDDLLPSAVAFEVLMNATAAAASAPQAASSVSTPKIYSMPSQAAAMSGFATRQPSIGSSNGSVLVPRAGYPEKSVSVRPHKKMIHVFRLSEGTTRKRSSRPRPVGKDRSARSTSTAKSPTLDEAEPSHDLG